MKTFDLLKSPLKGSNLIEASAGTGKTYTITGIFLRLILEKQLPVEQILVVTFTEAATAELKERIRNKLKEARECCITGETSDPFIENLIARQKDKQQARSLLTNAIRSFDQAAIFTIHGFCLRILNEYAFESGSQFDTELITDLETFKQEIIDDFWRNHLYTESPLFVNFILGKHKGPDKLISFNESMFTHKGLNIIPQKQRPDTSQSRERFKHAFADVASSWQIHKTDIEAILLKDSRLNRKKYPTPSIPGLLYQMDACAGSSGDDPFLFKDFQKFTASVIVQATKKGHEPPSHVFFDLCEELKQSQEALLDLFEQSLIALKIELIVFLQAQLIQRKKEQNIRSFDDLLHNLDNVLEKKEDSVRLVNTLRNTFKAALIDEFQDTDPIQYSIFRKLFDTENNILFLIGDPKQAIYGFRGADIFTYMDAAKRTKNQYTLDKNWRSNPSLVNAINTIFNNSKIPFIFDDIEFHPVLPALSSESCGFISNGEKTAPFYFWFLSAENGNSVTKTIAREKITLAVAAEISRLLAQTSKICLDEKRIRHGDIAVLVRRNVEAEAIQQALSDLNIKSVIYSSGNIFDSFEAQELERVLQGIISPNQEAFLKSALATQMMGFTGNTLFDLMQDEFGFENIRERFRHYHQMWHTHGFIRMFNDFLKKENILSRLMRYPDGERRSTNIRHLADILHETSVKEHPGMAELMSWLSTQRNPQRQQLEEHQLRLESDENAVTIVTIHKSKGLEYPIVFCPFTWDGSKFIRKPDYFSFHDPDNNMQLTLDFGSENSADHIQLAEKEILAENMRLLYVALTRAKNSCYFVFGDIKEAESSAPAHLLYSSDQIKDTYACIQEMANQSKGSTSAIHLPLDKGSIYIPLQEDIPVLECRRFSGDIELDWQFASFSSLIQNHFQSLNQNLDQNPDIKSSDEIMHYDPMELGTPPLEDQEKNMFHFPKGTTSGTCLHDIFEHLEFTEKDPSLVRQLVTEKLLNYGLDSQWQETVSTMIHHVLNAPLDKQDKQFVLSNIPSDQRITELEFYFPVGLVTSEKLKQVFRRYEGTCFSSRFTQHIGRLNINAVKGFLKGFVDLIFTYKEKYYVLDWKSNFLGNNYADYLPETLAGVMEDDLYVLQYLIYSVAVSKYLETRMPFYSYESGFGGVFYIFLRGVNHESAPGCGIYNIKPDPALIRELTDILSFHEAIE